MRRLRKRHRFAPNDGSRGVALPRTAALLAVRWVQANEELITRGLRAAFPDHQIIGEEAAAEQGSIPKLGKEATVRTLPDLPFDPAVPCPAALGGEKAEKKRVKL